MQGQSLIYQKSWWETISWHSYNISYLSDISFYRNTILWIEHSYFIGDEDKRNPDDTTTKPDTVHHSEAVESASIPTYRRHHGNRTKLGEVAQGLRKASPILWYERPRRIKASTSSIRWKRSYHMWRLTARFR